GFFATCYRASPAIRLQKFSAKYWLAAPFFDCPLDALCLSGRALLDRSDFILEFLKSSVVLGSPIASFSNYLEVLKGSDCFLVKIETNESLLVLVHYRVPPDKQP